MYLFIDTETGGIDWGVSLLQFCLLVTDDKLDTVDELTLNVKPDLGVYRVAGEALEVNKINLAIHHKIAIPYGEAAIQLHDFLEIHGIAEKLIPVGHNVKFDIVHLINNLISRDEFEKFVSYRCLDTQSAAQFLLLTKKLDSKKTTGSLESLATYFNIRPTDFGYIDARHHDARYDVMETRAVLRKLISL